MDPDRANAEFVHLLTSSQDWLRAFVRTLMPRVDEAEDVLQRTNLVLWSKADQFAPDTNFRGWACQVARYEVLAYRKEQRRDRHVFGDVLLGLLADEAEERLSAAGDPRDHLENCLERLPAVQHRLILERYREGGSVQQIARRDGRSAESISAKLYRIRKTLLDCLQRQMSRD